MGANPVRLAIAGDGSDDIHVVNNGDYTVFRQQLEQRQGDKRVVILGAGLIAVNLPMTCNKQDTKSRWLTLHHNR